MQINSETLIGIWLTWAMSAIAKSSCNTNEVIKSGTDCKIPLSVFKPSQLYVGFDEISMKMDQFEWYDTGKKPCYGSADDALQDAGITVVQGIECDRFYIADGHHTLNAAWQYFKDPNYSVKVEVLDSYCHQSMTEESFWSEMINQSYAFPYALDYRGDLSVLSARGMSEQVPTSLLAMTDWWYRSLAYVVKAWGDFHPLKDNQGHAVPFGKFFEGQCLKDLGVIPQNITRSLAGNAASLFDDEKQLLERCQLSPAPERRAVSDIIERDLSC